MGALRGFVYLALFFSGAVALAQSTFLEERDRYPEKVSALLKALPKPHPSEVHIAAPAYYVVWFMGTQCPLVARYHSTMVELQAKWIPSTGAQFVGVFSNRTESAEKIQRFGQKFATPFPLVWDREGQLAAALRADRTPEVFVLDKRFKILYRGAIDDQNRVAGSLPAPKHHYLGDTLKALAEESRLPHTITPVEGCFIASSVKKGEGPTYVNEMGPLVERYCVDCHRAGEVASQFPLTNYEEIAGQAETIAERVVDRVMPPWRADGRFGHFQRDSSLDINEIWRLRQWVSEGAPRGEGDFTMKKGLVPRPEWRIGKPDAVVYMTPDNAEPRLFTVPADGVLPYQHFRVKTDFGEDKWLLTSEIKAMAPQVVHHVNIFMLPPEQDDDYILRGGFSSFIARSVALRKYGISPEELDWVFRLYGVGMRRRMYIVGNFNPSHPVLRFPAEHGILIPRGAELIFECHYTPNGTVTPTREAIAFKFADKVPVHAEHQQSITRTGAPRLGALKLEPGEKLELRRTYTFFADAHLFKIRPHMHLRGRSYRAVLEYPDGRKETLLYVPRFDYQWQVPYDFEIPVALPQGSRLHNLYSWDNSKENPLNPDPESSVKFGLQIQDEMAMSFVNYAYDDPAQTEAAERELEREVLNGEDDLSSPSE